MTEICCQARHPTRQAGIHGARLATVPFAAEPEGYTVSDLKFVQEGQAAAWCPTCKRATVYRIRTEEAA